MVLSIIYILTPTRKQFRLEYGVFGEEAMGEKLALLREALETGRQVVVRDTQSGKEHRGTVRSLDEKIPSFPAVQIETTERITHHPDLRSAMVVIAFA